MRTNRSMPNLSSAAAAAAAAADAPGGSPVTFSMRKPRQKPQKSSDNAQKSNTIAEKVTHNNTNNGGTGLTFADVLQQRKVRTGLNIRRGNEMRFLEGMSLDRTTSSYSLSLTAGCMDSSSNSNNNASKERRHRRSRMSLSTQNNTAERQSRGVRRTLSAPFLGSNNIAPLDMVPPSNRKSVPVVQRPTEQKVQSMLGPFSDSMGGDSNSSDESLDIISLAPPRRR